MKARRLVFGAVTAALVVACAEGVSYAALYLFNRRSDEPILTRRAIYADQSARIRALLDTVRPRMVELDSELGWRYRAGFKNGVTRISAQGLRSRRLYARKPVEGVLRVAAFGDSFVYGNEVGDADAWAAQVERLDPTIEVLNYGVGGYGDDQALLRYLDEGDDLEPDLVILGFMPDDLGRLVNVYRRFRSEREYALVKPRYVLGKAGDLVLLPPPLQAAGDWARYLARPGDVAGLGRHDYWYEPAIYRNPLYDYSATVRLASSLWIRVRRRYLDADRLSRGAFFSTTSSAFRIQLAVFHLFADSVRVTGAMPALLFFPDRESVQRSTRGLLPRYNPLVVAARAMGIECLDGANAFARDPSGGTAGWFDPGGHYSPAGNLALARWLVDQLGRMRGEAPIRVAAAGSAARARAAP